MTKARIVRCIIQVDIGVERLEPGKPSIEEARYMFDEMTASQWVELGVATLLAAEEMEVEAKERDDEGA